MKYTLIIILLIFSSKAFSQKVGINIELPQVDLDVRSLQDQDDATLRLANPSNTRFLELFSGNMTFPDPVLLFPASQSLLFASSENSFSERMRIAADGKIGMGVTNPQAKLDLQGGSWNLGGGSPGDFKIGSENVSLRFGIATGGGGAGDSRIYSSRNLILGADSTFQLWLDHEGNTGVNTSNPQQKLHVNGKLQIGDDEGTPTEGTIRYNSTAKEFQGYDGSKWINLGVQASPGTSSIPYFLPDEEVDLSNLPFFFGTLKNMVAHNNLIALRYEQSSDASIRIFLLEENGSGPWNLRLEVTSASAGISSTIGAMMALSGDRLLLSDSGSDNVREYKPAGASWTLTHTFIPPNPPGILDEFGKAVAMCGDLTIIGNPGATEGGISSGAAYIYDGTTLVATMLGQGRNNLDGFGSSVAINKTRAVAGAPFDDGAGGNNIGSATIYNKVGNIWSANQTFFSNSPVVDGEFGKMIDLQNTDFMYVGDDAGEIEIYAVENGFWTYKEKLNAPDPLEDIIDFKNRNSSQLFTHTRDLASFKPDFITLLERASDNTFSFKNYFIDGVDAFTVFAVTDTRIYLGGGGVTYIDL